MPYVQNTLAPYAVLAHKGIKYGTCEDYNHISRYRRLRQVTHNYNSSNSRFVSLETQNPYHTNADVIFYEVPYAEENRLDLIANKLLGSASYSWVISYFNDIEDGYTVREGQVLQIPTSVSQLYNKGEILSSISPFTLNLGYE